MQTMDESTLAFLNARHHGPAPSSGTITLLVVEDEPLILFEAADCFEEAGYDVLTATNAAEALKVLEAHPEISVLFTDVQMPGAMNGLALARTVQGRWPDTCVIVTSGHVMVDDADLPASGVRFFPKPYMTEDVIAEIDKLLSR